ncbi:MAG: multicopper oxidase family protein [Deltaproteobacteria bacterium]|nr:multicopper oxidase family protein [Deltaproteobacteria bacterium]
MKHAISKLIAFSLVTACGADPRGDGPDPGAPALPTGRVVTYDLEVTEFDWEVAPGAVYRAIGYNRTLPGPVIEANAGDRITIRLTNRTSSPRSVHTHISFFAESSDGAWKGIAQPGETITVELYAAHAGTFPYHDHAAGSNEGEGIRAGLFGAVVVHDPRGPRADVENLVVLADLDMARFKGLPNMPMGPFRATDGEFHGEHQYMHSINGRTYTKWVPRFRAKVGDRVRWRVVSLGGEFHTFHVHGHRWLGADGVVTDNVLLGPGMYTTFDWREDNPGEWLFHCHVPEHMEGGMMGIYEVSE